MAEVEPSKEASFGRLVLGKAVSDTAHFLRYTKRDIILAAITLLLGVGLAYVFVGKADTVNEMAFIAAFTFAPAGIVMIAIFIWHLWLAPSALAYEAVRRSIRAAKPSAPTPTTTHPRLVDWRPWKFRDKYTIGELSRILCGIDPNGSGNNNSAAFGELLIEEANANRIKAQRGYENYATWSSEIKKTDAIAWAKAKGINLSHIE